MYKGNKPRVRYILSGLANPDEPISCFRLVAATMLRGDSDHEALRVVLPDDLTLNKYTCDSYSTTEDARTLQELGATPVVKVDGKWTEMPELWPSNPPCEWYHRLRENGLYGTLSERGYLNRERYEEYLEVRRREMR